LKPLSRRPRSRPRPGSVVVPAIGAVVGLAAVVTSGLMDGWAALFSISAVIFAIFVAVTDQLEIPLDRGGYFTLGLAPALGFALLNEASADGVGRVALVYVFGGATAVVIRLARRREMMLGQSLSRLLVVVAAAASYDAVVGASPGFLTFGTNMSGPGLVVVVLEVFILETFTAALISNNEERLPLLQIIRARIVGTGPLVLSSVSVAALLALAYGPLGRWTLPLFVVPLAATAYSFRQVTTIKRNYLQTVRALAKVPEMAGYTVRGHSARVARLAVAIAKEMGTSDPEVAEIEYAALLHDIGRVSLPDPEETAADVSRLELALVGAEIVEKTGHFPRVAEMVRLQDEPYRRRGEDTNRSLPPGAKIIKVASAYDDLTQPTGPGRSSWDAIERLHSGMAYDYDPHVIQALTRVLDKSGPI
jgi:putative nucleotidyltransferase with HDIG domain